MSKKHFIRLADYLRNNREAFDFVAIARLADFCQEQNPNFNRKRWLSYIAGECGPSGGRVNRAA